MLPQPNMTKHLSKGNCLGRFSNTSASKPSKNCTYSPTNCTLGKY